MTFFRAIAGPLLKVFKPIGLLMISSAIASIGLFFLSASAGILVFVAATIYGFAKSYFWPTMIGAAAEYIPKTGALGMSILGGAGFVATSMVLPIMGQSIETSGPQMTLRNMTVLPLVLIVAFIILSIWVKNRNKKESIPDKGQVVR